MQLKTILTNILVLIIFNSCTSNGIKQPSTRIPANSSAVSLFRDKKGNLIKTFTCQNCDTANKNYFTISKYYSNNKLVLVEEATKSETRVCYINYNGSDTSLIWEAGYQIFNEYFSSRGITQMNDPRHELRVLLIDKGEFYFKSFVDKFTSDNFNIKLDELAKANLIFYLRFETFKGT